MIALQGKSPKILVVGDLMIDHYLWGSCERISPEAPVQVVNVKSESSVLGGAGNVIHNLRALGAQVDVISVIGGCEISDELKNLLDTINVDTQHLITQQDRITSKKSRIIAAHQQVVRYDRESTDTINSESQKSILASFEKIIANYDTVLLSDYGKGVLTGKLTQLLITIANKNNKKVLVDPKGLDYAKYKGAFLLTPNKKEASEATQVNIKDDVSLKQAITQLKTRCNLSVSLITLSEQGVAIYDDNLRTHPTVAREVFDVTGAGDTVLASLGFALACDYDIDNAVEFANLAAGVVVGKIGSATATLNEIIEYESSLNKSSSDTHIKTLGEITTLSDELKARDKKIVFTNGCFDILHAGHVRYLETAKSYGDVLILGLNSDRSVTALKGENRPINLELDRAYILAALEAVDYVVVFNEDTPYELIKAIQPHILVKGGDYEDKEVAGQDIADELKLVQFVDGKSTTKTIEKIQKSH
ncbi:ADP-heptose synthase / D-glycero-beta-D-manno-heptose 7-phosphate kinase [Bathymodiolus heckerae thiotrophic gill symbiont]|uniref:D-glycero-beta-D-manno-heptose-7-phosphate kinase n=1 Tax=Bathymodiolus heckerae thiotrophic gill symbiont TaxID=1052212 RepID=UPI0010B3F0D9|nr:D-glycero-beta-D-manno-heptose-7-phosphate kinase [Bathymodiolus heckerae thiotrophic gill symbiont]CAC9587387.1 D-glycero-beta-D-manno-heptose 1-phosphate adenylyltransferase (EC 2.7.7.70) / D-glycero-beta-D-manno-heptose-7-phosphate kinase (EC 2.7.1.167) [uncultured Gammaproteobacteria bacterium]SHN90846.1 ADP-heptose synthase / D-glycero-beta-D-manno-heptose 7-phosphate kinase [Bathymodiolus heckerae thiotrophic gill symbiont]